MDCEWDIWSAWSGCTVLCGGGTQLRQRIIKQFKSYGGLPCQGQGIEQRSCGTDACPGKNILIIFPTRRTLWYILNFLKVNCEWDQWSTWSSCESTCGGDSTGGTQDRHRSVKHPLSNGGLSCQGSNSEQRFCNSNCCPGKDLFTSTWQKVSL